jgi:hypothetical protein
MNILKNPWHVSLLIFAIWELVIMKIEFLPLLSTIQPNCSSIKLIKIIVILLDLLQLAFLYAVWLLQITYHRDSVIKKIDLFSAGIDIKRNITTENLKLRIKYSFFRNIGLLIFIKKTGAD